jgi:hypothetical protein
VSDRVNRDRVSFDREQHTPVADAQPHSGNVLECFHIAGTGFRKRLQFEIDLPTRSRGQLAPLPDGGGSECDFLHISSIAL